MPAENRGQQDRRQFCVLIQSAEDFLQQYTKPPCGVSHRAVFLKFIIIWNVLHNILYTAGKDIAKPVDRIDLNVFIAAQSVQEGTRDIMMCIKIILRNAALSHGFPEPIVLYHPDTSSILT